MFCLEYSDGVLYLKADHLQIKPITVDFLSGKVRHRYLFGGGQGQLIARAVGVKKLKLPTVLDLTAGLGQDAFVLAALGCHVTMLERCDFIAKLLDDGLKRLSAHPDFASFPLKLIQADSREYLRQLDESPDVIYLDPMYPDTGNTALNKKEMRVLRELVGDDVDAQEVFELALTKAKKRVVVKRPRKGQYLTARKPDIEFLGKSSRFDVYL